MKTILFGLMVGMIGLVIFTGDNGLIAYVITGTSTSDTFVTAVWPIAWATGMLVLMIMKGIGKKKTPQ